MKREKRQEMLYQYLAQQNGWVKPATIVNELSCYNTNDATDHLNREYTNMRYDVKNINSSLAYERIIVSNNLKGYKLGTQEETEEYRAYLIRRLKSLVKTIKTIDTKRGNNNQLYGLDQNELAVIETYWEDPESNDKAKK